jgi:hypothetical protein
MTVDLVRADWSRRIVEDILEARTGGIVADSSSALGICPLCQIEEQWAATG